MRRLAALVTALALAGCASPIPQSLRTSVLHHVVASDAEGRPVDPFTREREPEFEQRVRHILDLAEREAGGHESVESSPCTMPQHHHAGGPRRVRKLLLHVHGGLNSDRSSLERADEKLREIDRELGDDWHYPIFLTWPSGGLESVGEHLLKLRYGSHYSHPWGEITAPIVVAQDLLLGVARVPQTLSTMLLNDAQVGGKIAFDWDFLPAWERSENNVTAAMANGASGFKLHVGEYERGGLLHGYHFARYLLFLPLKLVTTPLAIDAFGKPAWEVMLHRATNTLRPTSEFEDSFLGEFERSRVRDELDAEATGAFARFFSILEKWMCERCEGDVCWEITLIGHSMGSIILNDALQLYPELPVLNVVYMAPACSIAEAEEALVPLLERNPKTQFYLLTLHPIAEAEEVEGWDVPSRGSLLEWIDLWFDSPDHPLDRRLGKWINAVSALNVFASVREQVTIKAFSVEGGSKPQKHGQFDEGPFWRESTWRHDGIEHY